MLPLILALISAAQWAMDWSIKQQNIANQTGELTDADNEKINAQRKAFYNSPAMQTDAERNG